MTKVETVACDIANKIETKFNISVSSRLIYMVSHPVDWTLYWPKLLWVKTKKLNNEFQFQIYKLKNR